MDEEGEEDESETNADGIVLIDDDEGDDWLQAEPDDWWQQEFDDPDVHIDVADGAVNHEGESVQGAINARLRRTTRLTFFDDESGDDEMQLEPQDFNRVTGLVDRQGWP